MMDVNQIIYLLGQDRKGQLSLEEQAALNQWLAEPKNRRLYHKLHNKYDEAAALASLQSYDVEEELQNVHRTIAEQQPVVRIKNTPWRFSAIAASLLLFIVAAYYIYGDRTEHSADQIAPGRDIATLILEDGTRIALDTISEALGKLHDIQISQGADQRPIYEFLGEAEGRSGTHIIQTPRGGQYTILLPDSSKVWLNAESSLEYPVDFLAGRVVKLHGEAYFDIHSREKDGKLDRFTVELADHKLEVLGTKFNVNAYGEDYLQKRPW